VILPWLLILKQPRVLEPLKRHIAIFKHDVYPKMYMWSLHGVVTLLDHIWQHSKDLLLAYSDNKPEHTIVEFASVLERVIAYGTTGNAKVLSKQVMQYIYVYDSLLKYGYPAIMKTLWFWSGNRETPLVVHKASWPCVRGKHEPASSSKRAQILTFGWPQYRVRFVSCSCDGIFNGSCRDSMSYFKLTTSASQF
jgi:hypothetical protein